MYPNLTPFLVGLGGAGLGGPFGVCVWLGSRDRLSL